MASIHVYQTKKGERRYAVRYRDAQRRERSKAFSTRKDAHALVERKRLAAHGRFPSRGVEARRLFNAGEARQWLRSRHNGPSLRGNGGR